MMVGRGFSVFRFDKLNGGEKKSMTAAPDRLSYPLALLLGDRISSGPDDIAKFPTHLTAASSRLSVPGTLLTSITPEQWEKTPQ